MWLLIETAATDYKLLDTFDQLYRSNVPEKNKKTNAAVASCYLFIPTHSPSLPRSCGEPAENSSAAIKADSTFSTAHSARWKADLLWLPVLQHWRVGEKHPRLFAAFITHQI